MVVFLWVLIIILILSYPLACYFTHIEMNHNYAREYEIKCIVWGNFYQFRELWNRVQYKDYIQRGKDFPHSLFIYNSQIPEDTDINESSELYLHASIIGFKHFTIWLNPIAYIRYLIWKRKMISYCTNRMKD